MEISKDFTIFRNRSIRKKNKREATRLMNYIFIGSQRIFFNQIRPEHFFYITTTNDVRKLFQIVPIIFLPDNVLARILHYVDATDLIECDQVSKRFNQIIRNTPSFFETKTRVIDWYRSLNEDITYEDCCERAYKQGVRCRCGFFDDD
jgi:hypothetical protein